MSKFVLSVLIILMSVAVFAQEFKNTYEDSDVNEVSMDIQKTKKVAVNAGFMMGGGSLVGLDFEFMPVERIGVQAGVGLSSFGLGVNYHFKEYINSPFVSAVYLQQGLGSNLYASYVGAMYNFRLKKLLQAGLGYGLVVREGPLVKGTDYEGAFGSLLFNLGLFFAF